ncbi:MAG: MAPEG family protein [Deltaproteobacteria bacterium]|nr:MAPEG family protein [Deltaproteobacteria bacterium]
MITLHRELLGPAIALVLWTFVMWTWMYATRIPAITKAKMKLDANAVRGEQMALLPPEVRRKADNYNHLFEQPTLFYPVAIMLALVSQNPGLDALIAWAFVLLRVMHSLWQSLNNTIVVRFALFALSSLVLMGLSVRCAIAVFASG